MTEVDLKAFIDSLDYAYIGSRAEDPEQRARENEEDALNDAREEYNALSDNQKLFIAYYLRWSAYDTAQRCAIPEARIAKLAVDIDAKALELLPQGRADMEGETAGWRAINTFMEGLGQLQESIAGVMSDRAQEIRRAFGVQDLFNSVYEEKHVEGREEVKARIAAGTLPDPLANIELPPVVAFADHDTMESTPLLPAPTAKSSADLAPE
ncbi:Hypothetical protein POVN_LOCUS175 [uncultured virus]|nr:Hypothetical protein POVN_LOCUS175 [uncultured virus]